MVRRRHLLCSAVAAERIAEASCDAAARSVGASSASAPHANDAYRGAPQLGGSHGGAAEEAGCHLRLQPRGLSASCRLPGTAAEPLHLRANALRIRARSQAEEAAVRTRATPRWRKGRKGRAQSCGFGPFSSVEDPLSARSTSMRFRQGSAQLTLRATLF
eukprot:scaffold392_cov234-Pinguiococcus_pyrenoidosus.AAC.3